MHFHLAAGSVIKDFPRERVKITTKWGPDWVDGQLKHDGSRDQCRAQCFGSLKRLGVKYLDMFIFRGPPDPKIPWEDTVRFMKVPPTVAKSLLCGICYL